MTGGRFNKWSVADPLPTLGFPAFVRCGSAPLRAEATISLRTGLHGSAVGASRGTRAIHGNTIATRVPPPQANLWAAEVVQLLRRTYKHRAKPAILHRFVDSGVPRQHHGVVLEGYRRGEPP